MRSRRLGGVVAPKIEASGSTVELVYPEPVVRAGRPLGNDAFPWGSAGRCGYGDPGGAVPTFEVEIRVSARGPGEPALDIAGTSLIPRPAVRLDAANSIG